MPRFAKVGLRLSSAALLRRPNRRRRSHGEADRLLAAASTLIAHCLADPDPVVTPGASAARGSAGAVGRFVTSAGGTRAPSQGWPLGDASPP
jgi:hypothetical protein